MDVMTIAPSQTFEERSPYVAYTEVDVLRRSVHPMTSEPLEVQFIVVTQIMEMHFLLLAHEWRLAQTHLRVDNIFDASDALVRSITVQRSLLASWEMLEPMSPKQYNRFRDHLGQASGFQSYGYREIEFLLGVRDENLLKPHRGMPDVYRLLREAFDAPSLFEDATAAARRRTGQTDVLGAWRAAYVGEDTELHRLAELLTSVADHHYRWRYVHYQSVRRILGDKPGTAGSSGLTWLKRAVDAPLFPELWQLRSEL